MAFFPFTQALISQQSLGFFGRYEDEINKRTAAENEFVVLKKVRAGDVGWV